MNRHSRLLAHLALMVTLFAPVDAWARPGDGQIGARSQASITMTVSVLPRFEVEERRGALEVTSNASKLRYDLIVSDDGRAATASTAAHAIRKRDATTEPEMSVARSDGTMLVLVVPD